MKFKSFASLCLFLWMMTVCGTLLYFKIHNEEESGIYDSLMGTDSESKDIVLNTYQHRDRISKQLLFLNEGERLEWRLRSDTSTFHLIRSKQDSKLTEHLENVFALLQERLYPMETGSSEHQLIRTLEADHAIYDYSLHHLLADDVNLSTFSGPGNHIIARKDIWNPLMVGRAKRLQISRKNNIPIIHAEDFKGTLTDWRELSL